MIFYVSIDSVIDPIEKSKFEWNRKLMSFNVYKSKKSTSKTSISERIIFQTNIFRFHEVISNLSVSVFVRFGVLKIHVKY